MIGSLLASLTITIDHANIASMPSFKDIALAGSDDAFKDAVKATASTLLANLILAKTTEERQACIERHKVGLRLCKEVHEANIAAINEIFA
jgi:hypothetical protein